MKKNFRLLNPTLSLLFLLILHTGCSKYNEPSKDLDKNVHFYVMNGEAVVSSFGHGKEAIVPSEVEIDGVTYLVTGIGAQACNKDVKKLHLPPTIKKISQSAFETNEIEELYLEDLASWCATEIEEKLGSANSFFSYSTSGSPFNRYTKLYVNNELVEDVLFIPAGVKKINDFVFQNFNCKKIVIGDDVQTIGYGAFKQEGAYWNIPSVSIIEEIDLGTGVVEIGQEAFSGCMDLKVLRLSDKLEMVGTWAFEYSNATEIYCPSLSTWFGIKYDWRNVRLNIDGAQLSNDYDLYIGGEKIVDVTVPSGVQLSDVCFGGANIKSVVFEEGVTVTGGDPFMNCSQLEKVVLPSTLEYNGCSFLGCDSLREVWAYGPVPKVYYDISGWWYDSAENMDNSYLNAGALHATLYVPEEYLKSYKSAKGWSGFREILPITERGVGE